jgi:hypothetical protein
MQIVENEIPRRARVDLYTRAEIFIREPCFKLKRQAPPLLTNVFSG